MPRHLPFLAVVTASIHILGCAAPTSDPTALCIEQGKLQCAFAFECCSEVRERADAYLTWPPARNQDECVELRTAICNGTNSAAEIAIARGRTALKPGAAQSCLDTLQAAQDACVLGDFGYGYPPDCQNLYEGLGDIGDDCTGDTECSGGLYCEVPYTAEGKPRTVDAETAFAKGACARPRDVAEECVGYGVRCAPDAFCNGSVCTQAAGAGEPCGTCASGLSCVALAGDGEYTCEPPGAVDDACTNDWECASSFCATDLDVSRCRPASENPAFDVCHGP